MFRQVLTPKEEDKNSKLKIDVVKDTNKKDTISLEYIFLNFH